jgi:hypothetical protein
MSSVCGAEAFSGRLGAGLDGDGVGGAEGWDASVEVCVCVLTKGVRMEDWWLVGLSRRSCYDHAKLEGLSLTRERDYCFVLCSLHVCDGRIKEIRELSFYREVLVTHEQLQSSASPRTTGAGARSRLQPCSAAAQQILLGCWKKSKSSGCWHESQPTASHV